MKAEGLQAAQRALQTTQMLPRSCSRTTARERGGEEGARGAGQADDEQLFQRFEQVSQRRAQLKGQVGTNTSSSTSVWRRQSPGGSGYRRDRADTALLLRPRQAAANYCAAHHERRPDRTAPQTRRGRLPARRQRPRHRQQGLEGADRDRPRPRRRRRGGRLREPRPHHEPASPGARRQGLSRCHCRRLARSRARLGHRPHPQRHVPAQRGRAREAAPRRSRFSSPRRRSARSSRSAPPALPG